MQTVTLRPGRDARLRAGHAWVFANEIQGSVRDLEPGGAVRIRSADGRELGVGTANPASLIAVRRLSLDPDEDVDAPDFYARRLREAAALREAVLPRRRSLRLVASEADGLPGLVVDRYADPEAGDVLAVQVGTLGMERRLSLLEAALREVFAPAGAVLRNESAARAHEGLERYGRPWFGEVPERVRFEVDGLALFADVRAGQKTGFFFDQAVNRRFARDLAAGRRVLDVFAHTGAWAVGAMVSGAREAVAVDASAAACSGIRAHAELNGVSVQVIEADARQALAELRGERFEHVYLDPPAFAKSRRTAGKALAAYRAINEAALRLVAPGGLLFTSSCSYHVREDRFLDAVIRAARRAGREVRLVRRGEQAPDHPVHPAIPETRYLKHLVLHVR